MYAYSIETDGHGYQIRIIGPNGGVGHIAASFPTRSLAQVWIDECVRIEREVAAAEKHPSND